MTCHCHVRLWGKLISNAAKSNVTTAVACADRFSGVEKLKDKAAAAAQAILEPGIATDGGQQMSRKQFGLFIRRFAAASGLTFSAITDFLLVVPVFDYDPAFTDPGMVVCFPLCIKIVDSPLSSRLYTYRHT